MRLRRYWKIPVARLMLYCSLLSYHLRQSHRHRHYTRISNLILVKARARYVNFVFRQMRRSTAGLGESLKRGLGLTSSHPAETPRHFYAFSQASSVQNNVGRESSERRDHASRPATCTRSGRECRQCVAEDQWSCWRPSGTARVRSNLANAGADLPMCM